MFSEITHVDYASVSHRRERTRQLRQRNCPSTTAYTGLHRCIRRHYKPWECPAHNRQCRRALDRNNRARMKQLARLVVEPKTTFRLAPGHVHIMLFRLKLNGTPDPTITFVTTDGERLPASFEIKSIEALGDLKIQ